MFHNVYEAFQIVKLRGGELNGGCQGLGVGVMGSYSSMGYNVSVRQDG